MSRDILKGVKCSDCFGTYDAHESACVLARIAALEAENARLEALVKDIREAAREADLEYHDRWHKSAEIREVLEAELESLRRIRDAAKNHTEMTQRCYCVARFVCSTCGIAEALAAHAARFGEGR